MNHYNSNGYPSAQWGGHVSQPYPSSSHNYASYPTSSQNHTGPVQHVSSNYGLAEVRDASNRGGYYSGSSYSHSQHSSPAHVQQAPLGSAMSLVQNARPTSSHRSSPHSHRSSQSQTQGQLYAHTQVPLTPGHPQTYQRPRSHSVAYAYDQPHSSPMLIPQHTQSNYSSHAQIDEAISISPQYPASPTRPFSCDMCALSFNRQHDLKRHRETHNGEKPYLCNGGCGKTFTRKDALKRHQLVKGCGKVDEAWP